MNLISCNKILNRWMPLITPLGVIIGLLLGSTISALTPFVTILFAFVTFSGAIKLKVKDFIAVLAHPSKLVIAFVSAHILAPFVVYLALKLLGVSSTNEATGYILLTATPIAVSSYIWSQILYGNGPLSLAIIFVDTILSPFVTPLTIRLLTSTEVHIDTSGMMLSLFWMVVLPSILGMLCNSLLSKEKVSKATPSLNVLSKLFLFCVIVINTSKMRPYISFSSKYLLIALGVIALVIVTFLISYAFGKLFCKNTSELVSVTVGGCMRNISASLVLAMAFFPPEAAFPVVFGIVFQQMAIGLVGKFIFKSHIKEMEQLEEV
ncbi:MAG: bile acid:sodium symporter family protein [Spirochaetales bacterium]|nr:bile acid:sodium symporter family protein [Spirochaetales bacterium]